MLDNRFRKKSSHITVRPVVFMAGKIRNDEAPGHKAGRRTPHNPQHNNFIDFSTVVIQKHPVHHGQECNEYEGISFLRGHI
jgi:hypothetical protein